MDLLFIECSRRQAPGEKFLYGPVSFLVKIHNPPALVYLSKT